MDKICELLGNEGSRHVALRKLKEKRKQLAEELPPQKTNHFKEWRAKKEQELKTQIEAVIETTVKTSLQGLSDTFSAERLAEFTMKSLEQIQLKLIYPEVLLRYLLLIEQNLEAACYYTEKGHWDERLLPIDAEISRASLNILKPFDESMINTERFQGELRFPSTRCGQDANGRWYDKWLTAGLNERKPILFDGEDYVEKLIKYYHEIYWATAEKERAAKAVPPPPPIQETPKPRVGPAIVQPASPLTLQGRIERIKQGGLR